jgi:hypothetical protein
MLILKLMSHLATAFVAFGLGTGIVTGFRYVTSPIMASIVVPTSAKDDVLVQQSEISEPRQSGIYFVAPSIGNSPNCPAQAGEIYPFGWDSYLQTNQVPRIRRMSRDGRWLFFETETSNGRSYEFFGIIPDSASAVSDSKKVAILGKLVRLTNGEIKENVDATYYIDRCAFK